MSRFPRSRNAKIAGSWGEVAIRRRQKLVSRHDSTVLWLVEIDTEQDGTRERYMGGLGPTRNFKETISLFSRPEALALRLLAGG